MDIVKANIFEKTGSQKNCKHVAKIKNAQNLELDDRLTKNISSYV